MNALDGFYDLGDAFGGADEFDFHFVDVFDFADAADVRICAFERQEVAHAFCYKCAVRISADMAAACGAYCFTEAFFVREGNVNLNFNIFALLHSVIILESLRTRN